MLGKHLPIKHRCCAERRPIVPRNPTFTSESRSLAVTRAQSSLNYATNPRYNRSFVESLPLPFRNEQKKILSAAISTFPVEEALSLVQMPRILWIDRLFRRNHCRQSIKTRFAKSHLLFCSDKSADRCRRAGDDG